MLDCYNVNQGYLFTDVKPVCFDSNWKVRFRFI